MSNRLTEAELEALRTIKAPKVTGQFVCGIYKPDWDALIAMARTLLACEKALSAERAGEIQFELHNFGTSLEFRRDLMAEALRAYAAALEREP